MTTSPASEPLAPIAQTPIARRTVLAGAAWSVPAIALTTGAPAFAASGTTLAFAKPSYTGPGCSTINGVQVSATDNGTPQAGVSVTISLSGGYVFTTGGTTSTGVTGSNGALTLPGITVPATGGTGTASATASGAPASSTTLRGTNATVAKYILNGTLQSASSMPTGSTPAFSGIYLAPDGRLLNADDNNSVLASNVATIGELYRDRDNWVIPLKKTDGTCTYLVNGMFSTGWSERTADVPAGSTPVASVFFLTSNGTLVRGDSGGSHAANVSSWGQTFWDGQNIWRQPLKKFDGSFSILQSDTEISTTGIPAGSTPAADAYFLTTDGRLIAGDTGSVLVTNVDSFGRMLWNGSNWRWPLKKTDGSFTYLQDGTEIAASGIPAGSTPVSGAIFLAPDGRLIDSANSNTVYATSVSTTGQILFTDWNGHWQMALGIAETTPSLIKDGAEQSVSNIPVDSKPAFASLFLTPDSRLLDGSNNGAVISTNIDAFGAIYRDQDNWAAPLRKSDGTCILLVGGVHGAPWQEQGTVGVPNGSTPVSQVYFLTADRELIYGLNGNISSRHVDSWGQGYRGSQGPWRIPLKKTDGTFTVLGDQEVATVGVPSGSIPAADAYFLAPDGRLIDGSTGKVLVADVASFGRMDWDNSVYRWPLKKTDGSFTYLVDGAETAATGIPSGSIPIASTYFLAPDGRLVAGDSGTVIAPAVSSCGEILRMDWSGHWFMPTALKKSSC